MAGGYEYELVERPFIDRLVGMACKHKSGDKDDPRATRIAQAVNAPDRTHNERVAELLLKGTVETTWRAQITVWVAL
ncbi:MAG: hypothetical protein GX162_06340 [Firmicutes bacterium]|jgi:hypothetical protein|nr:hypothetical protein [Bacillota bacterium]